ncbi:hypothetical protein NG895_07955 [Aeoliella sp. ICT_H6.2]|uniref:Uncharacterized protein n=1 Tax=Aeoliella straminimaris TaxID=2954799 RepID=A0A9X2F8K0_9BACT|nr:hypothetical protein [Aeoliella straminimaris]MCO6043839.1 hypothetical protein [Aeoliella straminimaris]
MLKRLASWTTRRKFVSLCVLVLLVLVGFFIAKAGYRAHLVSQELARLRAAGVPTNAKELNAFVAIPRGEPDATAAWKKPLDQLVAGALGRRPYGLTLLDGSHELPPPPGEPWDELEAAQKFLQQHKSLYDDIDAAIATPGRCCFIPDHSQGLHVLLPHVTYGRMVVKLLKLRASMRLRDGDTAGAARDLRAMLQTAAILRDDPYEVSQFARMGYLELTYTLMEQLLPHIEAQQSELEAMQSLLEEVDMHRGLELAAMSHRVMGMVAFDNPATGGAGNMPTPIYQAWIGDNELEFLQLMRDLDEGIEADWQGALALNNLHPALDWQDAQRSAPLGRGAWFAPSLCANKLATDVPIFAEGQARASAAAAGIAAARFHHKNDQWPASLDEMVPEFLDELPMDPFTGEPLKMIGTGEEITIYSVGPNLKDDGGVEIPEVDSNGDERLEGKPDIVFRFLKSTEQP